jgi:TPR repeat protein
VTLMLRVACATCSLCPRSRLRLQPRMQPLPVQSRTHGPRSCGGDAEAQRLLGLLYASGTGVEKDASKAEHWYRQAAAQGDAQARRLLGALVATRA